ncbi:MAG: FeoB-associated Cys-rich membrane protein [Clostridia bacterium]|nr:FeoB-associated Cys-rich membrane protein [Clostridia bacterium]
MNLPTLTTALLVAGAAWGSLKSVVNDHKNGGCCGGCGGCPNAGNCHSAAKES